jgi:photosystem II stability/assembly factor-like uncharacterized protein
MTPFHQAAVLIAIALAAGGCATAPAPHDPQAQAAATTFLAQTKMREGSKARRRAPAADFFLADEADESGPPRAAQILRAAEQRRAVVRESEAKRAGIDSSKWTWLGPGNIGGRLRAIAIDPRNANRIFVGAASGGIWVSVNGGAGWAQVNDFLPNLSITSLVFDANNASVMYAGTGEASAGLVGIGIFKSVDDGLTWTWLAATNPDVDPDWRFVNRIAAHPAQSGVLLAGTSNGNNASLGAIFRSLDGGASWTRAAAINALDIAFEPSNPNNAVAGLDDGTIAYSRDAGATWLRSAPLATDLTGRGNTARAEIAFARSRPGLAYASLDNLKGQVWRSLDSGATWELLATPEHLNLQGNYDNAIWVDPVDSSHVITAGLDIYQSRDGGITFSKVSDWRRSPVSPHADHHAIVSVPNFSQANPMVYFGNDGGLYRAPNAYAVAAEGAGWQNMNSGLGVTQFYSVAGRAAAGGRIVGGTQDNGSLATGGGGDWRAFRGGDGGFSAVDPRDDTALYGEYVYASVHRSRDGGFSAIYICSGITEALPNEGNTTYCGANNTQKANFISPFILDPNNPDRMLLGANSLWASDNAFSGTPPAWRTIKPPFSATSDNFINAIAVAPGNSSVIWVGQNNGEVLRTLTGLAAVPSWTRMGQGALPARRVQRIAIDANDPGKVTVAFTGFSPDNLWRTTDGGATWRSITGNLPFAPIFDVKRHAANRSWLYVGTSVGVFASEDDGANWSASNDGPATVRVRELAWYDDNTLLAGTYGRGIFKGTVSGATPNYQDLWWAGPLESGWGVSIIQHRDILFVFLFIYDSAGKPLWVVMSSGTWNATHTAYTGDLYIPVGAYFANYNVAQHAVGAPVGTATLTFSTLDKATLSYTINGVSGTKQIERQLFGPVDATPVGSWGDLWWAGIAQNGWGISVSQQYRKLFGLWYTYDQAGKATWFVLPDGTWNSAGEYTGTAYKTTGPPWIGVPYNAAQHSITPVGSITLTFNGPDSAVMRYTIEGVSGTNNISRVPF